MRNRRDFLIGASSAAITMAALGWTSPAWAPGCPSCKTTSLLLALQGTIFLPRNPCVPAGENVSLAGEAHVVTRVGPNFATGDVNILPATGVPDNASGQGYDLVSFLIGQDRGNQGES